MGHTQIINMLKFALVVCCAALASAEADADAYYGYAGYSTLGYGLRSYGYGYPYAYGVYGKRSAMLSQRLMLTMDLILDMVIPVWDHMDMDTQELMDITDTERDLLMLSQRLMLTTDMVDMVLDTAPLDMV